jgi:hypothetical protein
MVVDGSGGKGLVRGSAAGGALFCGLLLSRGASFELEFDAEAFGEV